LLENGGFSHVAGMDNHGRAAQRFDRLGAEQTMRVGNDAEQHETSL